MLNFGALLAASEQRETMFITEALAGDASLLTAGWLERLAQLTQLCPSDFAAIKRQVVISGCGTIRRV